MEDALLMSLVVLPHLIKRSTDTGAETPALRICNLSFHSFCPYFCNIDTSRASAVERVLLNMLRKRRIT
jgi:hypothetical protein